MRRFYSDEIKDGEAVIKGEEANHIKNSVRMKTGDELIAIDGSGTDYYCVIREIGANVHAEVIKIEQNEAEPYVKITLYQAYPKSAKMNEIVQKAVELGVFEIVPFLSKRCVKRPHGQADKLSKVVLSAVKQCGRSYIPHIADVKRFTQAKEMMKRHDLLIVCYEEEHKKTLAEALQNDAADIGIVIGSEGGFEAEEVESIKEIGGIAVTLGRRIMRTETAGIAVLAACFYEKGQMQY